MTEDEKKELRQHLAEVRMALHDAQMARKANASLARVYLRRIQDIRRRLGE